METADERMAKLAAEMAGTAVLEEDQLNTSAYNLIVAFLKSDKLEQFRQLQTPEERLRFMYKHEAYWPLLQGIKKGSGGGRKGEKDVVLSRQMRDAGNTAFQQMEDQVALDCYNQALLTAPADPWDGQGEEMALALANRSALFLRQGKTAECLADTTLALRSGYPKHLRYKLLQRHAKCLCDIGSFREAKAHFREALACLAQSKLSKEQKNNVRNEVQSAIDAIQIKDGLESALKSGTQELEKEEDSPASCGPQLMIPKFERNPKFPALHKAITIKYDGARGRHAIATESIKCGTYLAFEKPAVSFLWADQLLSHCSSCFRPVTAPVPCYTCCSVVFCSDDCRTSAWNSFHQYECKALEGVTSMYQNLFVAYRAIVQKPLRYFLQNLNKFSKYDYHRAAGCYNYQYESDSESGETEPESEDETHEIDIPYRSSDYQNLYNLVTHSSKASEADRLAYSTSACLLLHYLQMSNYFGSSTTRDPDRELGQAEIYIGKLLYHILEVLQFNTQDISEAAKWDPEKGIELSVIGCAVSPTVALFNHSCAPNTTRANLGPSTLVVATEDIKKGQEISYAYTMLFQDKLLSRRKQFLNEHYKFTCSCVACTNQWPIYEFLNKSTTKAGANSKSLQYVKKMFTTITKLTMADLSVGHYERVHTMWSNYYSELAAVLEKPNKSYIKLTSRIQDVLWLRYGSRGCDLVAPAYRDHRINQRRSSSNMNIPHLLNSEDQDEEDS